MTIDTFYAVVGGDYRELRGRLPSEALILRFLLKLQSDPTYAALSHAMETHNLEEAFRAAHTIKGICLNLNLGHLRESSSALTEALRPGKENALEDIEQLYLRVTEDYRELIDALSALESQ